MVIKRCEYERTYQCGLRAVDVINDLKPVALVKLGITLKVPMRPFTTRPSWLKRSLGVHYDGASIPFNCPKDQHSLVRGALRRILVATPEVDAAQIRRFRSFVRMYLRTEARRHGLLPLGEMMDFEQWLLSTNYPDWRKDELREVNRRIQDGVPYNKMFLVKIFSKIEGLEGFKDNRIISARVDFAKVAFGPFVKSIEQQVYACLPEFVKHVPVRDYPALIEARCSPAPGEVLYATDYTSFEGHFAPAMIRACEGQLYKYMAGQRFADIAATFVDVLAGQNVCQSPLLSYTVDGCRMSGDMCTSLGNGFTNLMIMKFLCHEAGQPVRGLVEGDDGLSVTPHRVAPGDFASLGYSIKLDTHESPEVASFCGQVFSRESKNIIVDPLYKILSVGWSSSDQRHARPKVMDGLLRAKAISLAYECPGCPIVQSLSKSLLRLTRGVKAVPPTEHGMLSWHDVKVGADFSASDEKLASVYREVTIADRLVMQRVYGYSVEDQLSLETFFEGYRGGPWTHPVVERHLLPYHRDHWGLTTHKFPVGSRIDELNRCEYDHSTHLDVRGIRVPTVVNSETCRDVFAAAHLAGRCRVVPHDGQ